MLRVLPKHRHRTDLSRSSLETPKPAPVSFASLRKSTGDVPTNPIPTPTPPSLLVQPAGTAFFNDSADSHWVLRNRRFDRHVVQQALNRAGRSKSSRASDTQQSSTPTSSSRLPSRRNPSLSPSPTPRTRSPRISATRPSPSFSQLPPSPSPTASPPRSRQTPPPTPILRHRRPRDRSVHIPRVRRHAPPPPPTPRSSTDDVVHSGRSAFGIHNGNHYEDLAESPRRKPFLRPPRRLRFRISDDFSKNSTNANAPGDQTPWSHPTPDVSADSVSRPSADRPPAHPPHHPQVLRSDRRYGSPSWRDDPPTARDRVAKKLASNGARWRGLLARKDLVDGKADAYCTESNEDITPRSSLDIEEATIEEAPSIYSWDDPPSVSVRGWRSNNSLSYRPKREERPRHIRVIGRQNCFNDLTDIVEASNEPCVSYDRQIFDPVSKLWTYVEASLPSSSPWELRAMGSPVTCSVSGTEEGVSTIGRGISAPPTTTAFSVSDILAQDGITSSPPPEPSLLAPPRGDQARNGHSIRNAVRNSHTDTCRVSSKPSGKPLFLNPKLDAIDVEDSEDSEDTEDAEDVFCDEGGDDTDLNAQAAIVAATAAAAAAAAAAAVDAHQVAMCTEGPAKRRNSSPACALLNGQDGEVSNKAYMIAREQWLGYSRKSVYGPANLEAVILASEIEEGARRASMV